MTCCWTVRTQAHDVNKKKKSKDGESHVLRMIKLKWDMLRSKFSPIIDWDKWFILSGGKDLRDDHGPTDITKQCRIF